MSSSVGGQDKPENEPEANFLLEILVYLTVTLALIQVPISRVVDYERRIDTSSFRASSSYG